MGIEIEFFRDDGSRISNGVGGPAKVSPTGSVLVTPEENYESTRLGKRFYLNVSALTIAATHNSPLAAATATPIVGITNPVNSGVAARIMHGFMTTISGTPPASAQPSWNYARSTNNISTNADGIPINGLIGGTNATSAMRGWVGGVALTGLGVASGQAGLLKHFGGAPFAGAIAANHDAGWYDEVNGGIVVPPGSGVMILAGSAAGTTWIVSAGMSWIEEVWPA